MNREDIIRMARNSGFEIDCCSLEWHDRIERFANLVAEQEREKCAKVCDDWPNGRDDVYLIGVAIRARGEK